MRDCYTIDIENALVEALKAEGFEASAPPVTADLKDGCVVVYRVGGQRQSYVQDAHQVSIDCYADIDAQACQTANELCGVIGNLEGQIIGGVPVYRARPTTLPYMNPDPRNQELRRYTFAAQVITRVMHTR